MIGEFIPFDNPAQLPILHHVAKQAQELMNQFANKDPSSAIHMRDHNGRTLHQSILSKGLRTFVDDAIFFLRMSEEECHW